jgi:uncharacterized protein (DUF1501 family)
MDAKLTRRSVLKTGAIGLTAFLLPSAIGRRVHAAGSNPVLVSIFQRGAADGLTTCVPTFDPFYYSSRPTMQVPPGTELPLGATGFGLYPAFAPLMPIFDAGDVALIHACGSPDPSRSHFDAQDFMDRAAPGNKSITEGWLNRWLSVAGSGEPIQGVSLRTSKAKSMLGPAASVAFESIADFALEGDSVAARRDALETRYSLLPGTTLGGSVTDAFSAVDLVASVDTTTSVVYPPGELGPVLQDAAALIKADIGIKVIAIDIGGWDHHSAQLAALDGVGGQLAASLAAFWTDLGACQSSTLTVAMTEFGRRVGENGALGTDHGHGGLMWALGGGLTGGRVVLKDDQWPGLAPANLFAGQDLAVTTDFRDVFAEILSVHMGTSLAQLAPVFPNFSVSQANLPGLYV